MYELALFDEGCISSDAFDWNCLPKVGDILVDSDGIEMQVLRVFDVDTECKMASVDIEYVV